MRKSDAFIGKNEAASQMAITTKINLLTILLLFASGNFATPVSAARNSQIFSELPDLPSSIESVEIDHGQAKGLSKLVVDGLIAFPIVQQPKGNPIFVSLLDNSVTEFQTASEFGTIGLLAHNYLAGQYFFQIFPGQKLELVYTDHSTKRYIVTEIQQYQALSPDSPSSDFIDLSTGEYLTATQLFGKIYRNQSGHIILQTCIYAEQNPSWGRLFIIAKPASEASSKNKEVPF